MANLVIRQLIHNNRLHYYEVAEAIGVHECTFSKWMRTEMPEEKKEKVMQAINKLISQK